MCNVFWRQKNTYKYKCVYFTRNWICDCQKVLVSWYRCILYECKCVSLNRVTLTWGAGGSLRNTPHTCKWPCASQTCRSWCTAEKLGRLQTSRRLCWGFLKPKWENDRRGEYWISTTGSLARTNPNKPLKCAKQIWRGQRNLKSLVKYFNLKQLWEQRPSACIVLPG